jgi:hypothetical protein
LKRDRFSRESFSELRGGAGYRRAVAYDDDAELQRACDAGAWREMREQLHLGRHSVAVETARIAQAAHVVRLEAA